MTVPILRSDALRAVEQANTGVTPPLMERAGAAAARLALELQRGVAGVPLIFAGPGNNGGDALVVARRLTESALAPVVVFCGQRDKLPADARTAFDAWIAAGGECTDSVPAGQYGLVIDGLFGIGLARAIEGRFAALVERINAYPGPVLALDCPSGLDGDSGLIRGVAVRASHTVTFMAMKPGLLTLDGPDHCGELTVDDLGLGHALAAAPHGEVVSRSAFAQSLHPRHRNSHKGSYGSAGILGGSTGMAGAALLAGRAALKLGAGRVYVGMLERIPVDSCQPELMLRNPAEIFALATALAIGPGLGQSAAAGELVLNAIDADRPLVLDADALNTLAARPMLARRLARRNRPAILTPHPAEAARLLERSTDEIQADRVGAAMALARRHQAHVVLKGCGSVIALSDGRWYINRTGNPGLASAGTGDVLTGLIVALLAQHWPEHEALLAAVHLHGAAADHLVAQGCGPVGLSAGEVIDAARLLLNRWNGL